MPRWALVAACWFVVALVGRDARAETCARRLSEASLSRSIELGTDFLLHNQRDEGNFIYGYDWHRRTIATGDSAVRQAGATWSLGLLLGASVDEAREDGATSPTLEQSLERALRFFHHRSRVRDGRRFILYPGDASGSTGAVALAALAHLEHLIAVRRRGLPQPRWSQQALDGYLAQLVASRRRDGGFSSRYRHADGQPHGPRSPYYDGESLLALVKAARYLGRRDLVTLVVDEARAGYRRHVTEPRRTERDPMITKGYYQWHSLALWELATWTETSASADWRERLIELAVWMIDDHRVLRRRRNTAYAFEGIVPAFALAQQHGDPRAEKLACAIEEGLTKLTRWQVGNDAANRAIRGRKAPPRAVGGVQNHAREPLLRVDVTQHQMHALLLARRLYLPARPVSP